MGEVVNVGIITHLLKYDLKKRYTWIGQRAELNVSLLFTSLVISTRFTKMRQS